MKIYLTSIFEDREEILIQESIINPSVLESMKIAAKAVGFGFLTEEEFKEKYINDYQKNVTDKGYKCTLLYH